MKKIIVTTSWDDGHILDIKLANLLKKYAIKGTFYISPEDNRRSVEERLNKEQILELSKSFEIGGHTMTHVQLDQISIEKARIEIKESKQFLESIVGRSIKSFCYPWGKYNLEHIHEIEKAGFNVGRTVKRFILNKGIDRYKLATTIDTYDHWSDVWHVALFVRFNPFKFFRYYHHWDILALAMFDRVLRKGGVFHLWGHSAEIEDHKDWSRLERVLQYISNRINVEYLTNSEIYE